MSPLLWVLAGGNGAGKTTFYEKYLAPRGLQMLSADDVARALEPADPNIAILEAQAWVEKKRERLFSNMESFCYETVFSHPGKIDAIARAKGHGYAINLTYFHLDTAQLNQARVSQRVSQGGHDVPPEKIVARIPRTMKHVGVAMKLVDLAHLLDNSSYTNPFQLIADVKDGVVTIHAYPLPTWASEILSGI